MKKGEVKCYLKGRYIAPYMSAWRIFGHPLAVSTVHVERLDIHLEGEQFVTISVTTDGAAQPVGDQCHTKLTRFFELCRTGLPDTNLGGTDTAIAIARRILYKEAPKYFTWQSKSKSWRLRKRCTLQHPTSDASQKSDAIGRVYSVSPRNQEMYALRKLLYSVRGPQSYDALRTVNGIVFETLTDAARALGIIATPNSIMRDLEDAYHSAPLHLMRETFCYLLCWTPSSEASAQAIYNAFKYRLCEDLSKQLSKRYPTLSKQESGMISEPKSYNMIIHKLIDMSPSKNQSDKVSGLAIPSDSTCTRYDKMMQSGPRGYMNGDGSLYTSIEAQAVTETLSRWQQRLHV